MTEPLKDGYKQINPTRCPHCGVSRPSMHLLSSHKTNYFDGKAHEQKSWSTYSCSTCGGVALTRTPTGSLYIDKMWPESATVSDAIPERAREFLTQALGSLNAPSGAQMLAASSVDAMLKEKGLKTGSLYARIGEAATSHLITAEMAEWAHEVRLDANDQRHADDNATLPTPEEAKKTIEFVQALAQFLFVLPAMVTRGRGKPAASAAKATPKAASASTAETQAPFPGTTPY